MLDIKLIRDEPDRVKEAVRARGVDPVRIDEVLEVDRRRRAAQKRIDDLRAEQKQAGKEVATLQGDDKQRRLGELKGLSDEITQLGAELDAGQEELRGLLLHIPNLPDASVPVGDESANQELRVVGEPRAFDFEARDHLALGEALGIIDMERAAKVSGSRFSFLVGDGVRLWLAIKQFAMDTVARHGHTPVMPPVLVRREAMEGTGFFPAAEDQIYTLEKDDLYLVGTSEVPLAAMHMDEILDEESLPLRYVAHSACFRREAGAGGKDTRGIFRNHQFEKVEMFVFTRPEDSAAEHDRLIGIEEEVMRGLGLPYRAVVLATGDMGAPSAKTVDLECWFPGQDRYRETTSCSNTTDYQARRLGARMRGDKGTVTLHTLNGTAATSSRTVAAVLENYQREDGTVEVPEVLRAAMGTDVIRPR